MNAADTSTRISVRRTKANGGAMWAEGTIAGYAFEALVFPEHAADPAFELHRSRISKLSVRVPGAALPVAEFNRGWQVRPVDDDAQQATDEVSAALARAVFGQ